MNRETLSRATVVKIVLFVAALGLAYQSATRHDFTAPSAATGTAPELR